MSLGSPVVQNLQEKKGIFFLEKLVTRSLFEIKKHGQEKTHHACPLELGFSAAILVFKKTCCFLRDENFSETKLDPWEERERVCEGFRHKSVRMNDRTKCLYLSCKFVFRSKLIVWLKGFVCVTTERQSKEREIGNPTAQNGQRIVCEGFFSVTSSFFFYLIKISFAFSILEWDQNLNHSNSKLLL